MSTYTRTYEAKAEAQEGGLLRFVASTAAVDSYQDIVEQTWKLDRFKLNPVFLLQHNSWSVPIGRVEQIGVEKIGVEKVGDVEALVASVRFDMDDPDAAAIAGKYKRGFMHAVSVGFRAGKMTARSMLPEADPRYAPRGYILSDNELLELSAVTIPANPEAVAQRAAQRGWTADELRALVRAELAAERDAVGLVEGDPWKSWR